MDLDPVSKEHSGEGFPYAPVNFSDPGDNWRWKVGKRVARNGYFLDRFLYPPIRFQVPGEPELKFRSMTFVKEFFETKFPDKDVDFFFKSFSWKVPSKFVKGKKLEFLQEVQQNVPEVSGERNDEATDQPLVAAVETNKSEISRLEKEKSDRIQMLEKKLEEAEKKLEVEAKKRKEAEKKIEEAEKKREEFVKKIEEATKKLVAVEHVLRVENERG